MNKVIGGFLALLLVSPLVVVALDAAGVGPGFEVEAPTWQSGYTWDYDVLASGRASGQVLGVISAQTETAQLEATRHAEVLNTTYDVDGHPLYAVIEGFRMDRVSYGDETVYDREADLRDVSPDSSLNDELLCLTPCQTMLATYTHDDLGLFLSPEPVDDTSDDPTQVTLFDFPLTRGKTWTVFELREEDVGSDGTDLVVRFEAKAVEMEYVNLPGMDPFEAVRVEAHLSEETKDTVRKLAKDEAAREDIRLDVDLDLHATYWYAPKVQNLVKLEMDSFVTGRGEGYGASGSFRGDMHFEQSLTGHRLVAQPERSMEEARHRVQAAWTETGQAVQSAPEPWEFHVVTDQMSVNADNGPTIELGLVDGPSDGDDIGTHSAAAPTGATVTWTHALHRDGASRSETEEHDGALQASLADPGQHVFTATATDAQGRILGVDSIVIEAYTARSHALETPAGTDVLAPVSHVGDTHAATLEVAPGAQAITWSLDGVRHGTGTVHLVAPDGTEQDLVVSADGAPASVDAPQAGTWSYRYADETRVGSGTVDLEVRYPTGAPHVPTEVEQCSLLDPLCGGDLHQLLELVHRGGL